MSATKSQRRWDGTMTWRFGEEVKLFANKAIFTEGGNLTTDQVFKDIKPQTSLITFEWLKKQNSACVTTLWVPAISNLKPDLTEFARSTAENLGLERWEVPRLVMERLLEHFGAQLLEVTFWGVKLGHRDIRSAQEVKDKGKNDVIKLLSELLADTEYLYRDAVVEWTVSIENKGDTTFPHTPIQESSYDSRHDRGGETNFQWNSPDAVVVPVRQGSGKLDVQSEFDFSSVGEKQLFIRALQKMGWLSEKMDIVQDLIKTLTAKVDDNQRTAVQLYASRAECDEGSGELLFDHTDTESYSGLQALTERESNSEEDLSSEEVTRVKSVQSPEIPKGLQERGPQASSPNNRQISVRETSPHSTVGYGNQSVRSAWIHWTCL